jgi:peptidoglycan/xylan/chitin deacetylase (PgdA/CDA1 family)
MKNVILLYHDVVNDGGFESSGFPGSDAAVYKIEVKKFRQHLDAILRANPAVTLTFDDGGVSSHTYIADELEKRGWKGYFFITTNWIGQPGFLDANHIRDLRNRGHIIGTHSCSHPARISRYTLGDIIHEWSRSSAILADIVGKPIQSGSVPGGYYSEKVARAAALAGLETLFTSEPTVQENLVEGCIVRGRFMIQRHTSAKTAAALARGAAFSQFRQSASWTVKKLCKAAGGRAWLKFRKRFFDLKYS